MTQMLEFMEYITEAIDNGDDVDIIYLDFCKAFDKVPHKKLLHKLHNYGITGQIYNWPMTKSPDRERNIETHHKKQTLLKKM